MLISPAHIGALGVRQAVGDSPPPTGQPSIAISPSDPPAFSSLPANWSPTVTVTGLTQIMWAVFQVSLSGQFTSNMAWQVVNVVGGTVSITASMTQPRDRLIIKSLDQTVEAVSGPAVLSTGAPPSDTDGLTMARNFVVDLTLGLNIERQNIITSGLMTTGQFQQYKDLGITHIRMFPPIGGIFGANWPNVAAGELDWLFTACERAMSVGLKVLLDLQDVCGPEHLVDGRIMPYISACGQRIAGRNWNVSRYTVGAVNEYAGGTNAEHRIKMHEGTAALRSQLPNSLLLCASAEWGAPDRLTSASDPFVPPPDDRILVQWHQYDGNADSIDGPAWRQEQVSSWSAQRNLVTINGEYGLWEPDFFPDPARFPAMVDASARGMGQQRPTFWTITDQGASRLNLGGFGANDATLIPNVAAAISAGSTYIKQQAWYTTSPTTGGGAVSRLQVLHRGQSNAYFAVQYGADQMLRATLAGLTALPVDLISRLNVNDDNTIHSGTSSFFDPGSGYDASWLDPAGNYASDPTGWGNRIPMQQTLNAVSRYVSSDSEIPLLDLQVHWENDLGIPDATARAAYRAGHWEVTRRIRAVRPKAAGKHVAAYGYCPYQGGSWIARPEIQAAWIADFADASRTAISACGNMLDGQPNTQYDPAGDFSHWGDQSAPRIYPRVAFRLAKYAYDRGWCPSNVDLSDCPSMGPYIQSATLSGNSITMAIGHDKGSSLVAGIDGIDWSNFTVSTGIGGSHLEATGGAITGASSIRADFPSQPPNGGRIWYSLLPNFRRKQLIRDNWHSIRPAKYANVANVNVVEFPLQQTLAGVAYT